MIKLVDYISSETGIQNKQLIEKDVLLQLLLNALSKNSYFRDNFVFKGGTCLTKCYYGYYRFSEDLDFSWIHQSEFKNKSQKEIRKALSAKIDSIMGILKETADNLKIDFKPHKPDKRYVELGGSNKFATFKLWYNSAVTGNEQFVKIQINFVEIFMYNFRKLAAKSIVDGMNNKELLFLFPEYKSLFEKNAVLAYDIKEILTEKCRAILTRRGIKARDFIDIYMILHKERMNIQDFMGKIIQKTKFMLRYSKYIQNLKGFNIGKFLLGEEEKLLLKPMPKGFEKFIKEITGFLNGLAEELKQK